MACLHVLCGFPGSGKTTFAKQLLAKNKAIRLANDDWMVELFGSNPPEAEFKMLVRKLEKLQWKLAIQLLEQGVDVIWDYGVWSKQDRADLFQKCSAVGAEFHLYHVQCDFEIAVARVLARYAAHPETELWINRAAMLQFKSKYEPPTCEEGYTMELISGE
jgi:predicted kinase